jgi:hypothetical protein
MAQIARPAFGTNLVHPTSATRAKVDMHPAWLRLMCYCAELGHGEIEKLKIQDGVPVIADVVREKVKFT